MSQKHVIVCEVFLWCLAAVYLFAFTSLYVQVPGLYGKDGVLPARNVVHDLTACVDSDTRCPMWQSWGECQANRVWMSKHCRKSCSNCQNLDVKLFFQEFNLLLLTRNLGLDTETGMEFLCLLGMLVSMLLLVSTRMRNCWNFGLLFLLYYSQHKVGQIFLWYQWDALLLETGFLAVLIAPFNISIDFKGRKFRCISFKRSEYSANNSPVSFWLLKWLLFRLMFSSGVVKLTYMDKTWWNLTALNWHYESQCIPSPLAWYFHHLTEWFQKLSVVMTYVIEIGIPFLFFFPVRFLRLFAAFAQVFLQLLIILTGNYNFFNLLTIILCLSLVDDKFFGIKPIECQGQSGSSGVKGAAKSKKERITFEVAKEDESKPLIGKQENGTLEESRVKEKTGNNGGKTQRIFHRLKEFGESNTWLKIRTFLKVSTIVLVFILLTVLTVQWFSLRISSSGTVQSKIAFSVDTFFSAVHNATCFSIVLGLWSLSVEIFKALLRCLEIESKREKILQIFKLVQLSIISLMMFGLSLVLYTGEIDRNVQSNIPTFLTALHDRTYHLEMVHSYGLFRSMTGVGGRPEVVIKGGDTPTGPWKEFDFLYKPGNVNTRPPFVAPHQPRLDWQMWFASLGTYDRNPWFLSLLHKFLLGKPQVLGLLDVSHFEHQPPQFIKVDLYRYHFTENTTGFWKALLHKNEQSWWSREYVSDYTPFILNRNDTKSFEVLIQDRFKLLRTDVPEEPTFGLLYSFVISLRSPRQGRLGPSLIMTLFFSCLVLLMSKLWWRRSGHQQFAPVITWLKTNSSKVIPNKIKNIRLSLPSFRKRIWHWCVTCKRKNLAKLNRTYFKWEDWTRVKGYAAHVKSWSKVECLKLQVDFLMPNS